MTPVHLLLEIKEIQISGWPPYGGSSLHACGGHFVDKLENRVINNFSMAGCIRYWARYVDNVLCV